MHETVNPYVALAAEHAIIGSLLGNEVKLSDVDLGPQDFSDLTCREIFCIMQRLSAENKPHDLVTVSDNCNINEGTLIDLMVHQAAVSSVLIPQYIRNVKEATLRRSIAETAKSITKMSGDETVDVLTALESMRAHLDDLTKGIPTAEVSHISDIYAAWVRSRFEKDTGYLFRTGIVGVDRLLGGGIRGSKFVVIGARPGVGKSALGLWIAMNAMQDGRKVLIVSLEMDELEIMDRMMARYSGVDVSKFEARTFGDEIEKLHDGQIEMQSMDVAVTGRAQTIEQIRSLALKLRHSWGLDLIVIDYLQLVETRRKCDGRTEQVSYISRQLKMLTMELKIPVIAMTQFNRESERDRETGRLPKMSESRESGAIEQDANIFIILHNPDESQIPLEEVKEFYRSCRQKGYQCLQIKIEKNRNGKKGSTYAAFDGAKMRFYAYDASFNGRDEHSIQVA